MHGADLFACSTVCSLAALMRRIWRALQGETAKASHSFTSHTCETCSVSAG